MGEAIKMAAHVYKSRSRQGDDERDGLAARQRHRIGVSVALVARRGHAWLRGNVRVCMVIQAGPILLVRRRLARSDSYRSLKGGSCHDIVCLVLRFVTRSSRPGEERERERDQMKMGTGRQLGLCAICPLLFNQKLTCSSIEDSTMRRRCVCLQDKLGPVCVVQAVSVPLSVKGHKKIQEKQ